jgi:hypothetical protein
MMDVAQVWMYIVIAAAAILVTLLLLLVTKIPTVVTIGSAIMVGGLTVLFARFDLGYWDPLAPVAFVVTAAFAFVVSFGLLALGRSQQWSLFVGRRPGSKNL